MSADPSASPSARHVIKLVADLLRPETGYLGLAVIYGIGISVLSLATPIAVQVLINSVGFTGLAVPLVVLSLTLFGLLLASGLLNAMRVHLMEIFARRFYARLTSAIALKALYAQKPFFQDDGRSVLFNRYFDILNVVKALPILLIGGFTVLLQAAVGFILTSFYHPLFLAFNVVVIALIWLIWLVWGGGAIKTAVKLSQEKHETAAWLQSLAGSNGYFKSHEHIAYALKRTDQETNDYVMAHRRHFRRHFSQTIGFLLLYATASAALLGLGGWLVIQGQLTLGQLVAAELVLSVAFYGVSQLGSYLNYFYDLCAAAEELSLLDGIVLEEPTGEEVPDLPHGSLVFDAVKGHARGAPAVFDVEIPAGQIVYARAQSHGVQRLFTNLLKRFESPKGGTLTLGGYDITSIEVLTLRRFVIVLDRPTVVEMSIRNYLTLAREEATSAEMLDTLACVGLDEVMEELEDGLDTQLSVTGWPLSVSETMRLKLAAAILARPKVLILNQLFDTLPSAFLQRAVDRLCVTCDEPTTLIIFSSAEPQMHFDRYLCIGAQKQTISDDPAILGMRSAMTKLEPVRAVEDA
ncbi:ABC transporter transmembrane domain-containing protein [Parvularcula maris]|uniref:ABC transporter ATP-binding protein/permease n=1 Tax=Parvularcula maris TaxID=2965077 RepID=A0A9X2L8C2_9PROT|nr:ABC transporter ATP-binding protein/permease [Parvularcula maris]